MDIKHRVPLLIGHILNDCVPGISGIVDNNIDTTKGIKRCLDELSWKGRIGYIASDDNCFTSSGADSSSSHLRWSLVKVTYHNRCAFTPEHVSCCCANSPTRAGQNSYFAFNQSHEQPPDIYVLNFHKALLRAVR